IGADGGPVETADDVHEGGLAGAGSTHNGDEFAALNRQADFPEHGQRLSARGIGAADGRQFEQWRRHQGPFRPLSALFVLPAFGVFCRITTSSFSLRPSVTSAEISLLMAILMARRARLPSALSTWTLVSAPSAALPIAAAGISKTAFACANTMKTWAVI